MDLVNAAHVLGLRITQGPTLAFLILMLALIVGPRLAEKLRLPAMVGLVLAGLALGPFGTRLLAVHKIALSALGDFGLLYLMFTAGLELDLKHFARVKKAATAFAALSFVIPFSFGLASAKLLGYPWAAAVLMGSNWGSHTLVTYPILRKMGLARNFAVSTVVGATAVTDTLALLVLSGVSVRVRKAGGLGIEGAEIAIGLAVLAAWTLLVLPRLARWFFAEVGSDRAYRYVFTIASFLSGAVLAEAASIDGIVGAFFAGLGLNRAIPERSRLMERVQFVGSSLFIPIFLVSVGVLLDPKVMINPKTLLVALVFTIAVLGGKSLAAIIAGRASHFSWPEVGVMAGLSGSQAAATLATTLVGAKLGLFDKVTINAVLVVILVSLVVTPAMVTFFGKKVPLAKAREEALGSVVLVAIRGESTRPLLAIAGRLAAADFGIVVAVTFAVEDAPAAELAAQRKLRDDAEEWLAKDGFEGRSIFRVAPSLDAGLLETERAESASLLVTEWLSVGAEPSNDASEMSFRSAAPAPAPILLVHGAVEPFERLLVIAPRDSLMEPQTLDLEIAAQLAGHLARGRHVAFVRQAGSSVESLFMPRVRLDPFESPDPIGWVRANAVDSDLLLFAGVELAHEAIARIAGLAQKRFLVAMAAHGEASRRTTPASLFAESGREHQPAS